MYKIVKKEVLNDVVELMEVHAPYVAKSANQANLLFYALVKMVKESH